MNSTNQSELSKSLVENYKELALEVVILEGTVCGLIKCSVKGSREWALNWGIPVYNDDVFPPSAVSDKLIRRTDSEVLQPPQCWVKTSPIIHQQQTLNRQHVEVVVSVGPDKKWLWS